MDTAPLEQNPLDNAFTEQKPMQTRKEKKKYNDLKEKAAKNRDTMI